MSAGTFKAAMIQMRAGLTVSANIDAAVRMIGEAKDAGAAYVQTPEMTNIMEVKRERLFSTIVAEEQDTSLATLRELARKLGIYVHVGSLAIKAGPERAANRAFLIDPRGEIAARYDKIHMFDVDLALGIDHEGAVYGAVGSGLDRQRADMHGDGELARQLAEGGKRSVALLLDDRGEQLLALGSQDVGHFRRLHVFGAGGFRLADHARGGLDIGARRQP